MILKKALSWSFAGKRSFLFNKKLASFLVFISLSVNGFAPSAAEVSKYSIVLVAASAAQSAIAEVFTKCDKSLVSIAGNFCRGLFNKLERMPLKNADKAGKKDMPGSSSSVPAAITVKQASLGEKNKAGKEKESVYFESGILSVKSKHYGRESVKVEFGGYAIVILFLIFVAAILRRKTFEIEKNKFIYEGKRISA